MLLNSSRFSFFFEKKKHIIEIEIELIKEDDDDGEENITHTDTRRFFFKSFNSNFACWYLSSF